MSLQSKRLRPRGTQEHRRQRGAAAAAATPTRHQEPWEEPLEEPALTPALLGCGRGEGLAVCAAPLTLLLNALISVN